MVSMLKYVTSGKSPTKYSFSAVADFNSSIHSKRSVDQLLSPGLVNRSHSFMEMSEKIRPEDLSKIAELRERLRDVLTPLYDTDFNLLRWLIGWNYDVDVIEPKLRKHLKYRTLLGLDNNPESFEIDPILKEYYPSCHLGLTTGYDNTIIVILCYGKMDTYGIYHSVASGNFLRSRIYYTEQTFRQALNEEAKTGERSGITYVLDLEGIKFDSWTISGLRGPFLQLANLLKENYVEMTQRILIINAGRFLSAVWRMIEPLLPQRTKEKIKVLSEDWRNEIQSFIKPENLPPEWGGTLVHPESLEENTDDLVIVPTTIPKDKFYDPSQIEEKYGSALEWKTVKRNLTFKFHMEDRYTYLEWVFKCDKSIDFGIWYSPNDDIDVNLWDRNMEETLEMVYPTFTLWPNYVHEIGHLPCTKPGYYYVNFHNDGLIFSKSLQLYLASAKMGMNH